MEAKEYWSRRAKTYGRLDDVKSKRTAYKIVNEAKVLGLNKFPEILDVGCGEGTITRVVRESFRDSNVLGIDLSEEMISGAMPKKMNNLDFKVLSFADIDYDEHKSKYDLIIMSLFLHHMTEKRDMLSVLKSKFLLKDNGFIIVAEAVPPEDEIFDWYRTMFKMKENRNCYKATDLVDMLKMSGFLRIRSTSYRFDLSLSSWLNDKTLSSDARLILKQAHQMAPDDVRDAYCMRRNGSDIILSCRMAIISCGKSLG